jgi:hypothetical protein
MSDLTPGRRVRPPESARFEEALAHLSQALALMSVALVLAAAGRAGKSAAYARLEDGVASFVTDVERWLSAGPEARDSVPSE